MFKFCGVPIKLFKTFLIQMAIVLLGSLTRFAMKYIPTISIQRFVILAIFLSLSFLGMKMVRHYTVAIFGRTAVNGSKNFYCSEFFFFYSEADIRDKIV